jgi:hypothetical protein
MFSLIFCKISIISERNMLSSVKSCEKRFKKMHFAVSTATFLRWADKVNHLKKLTLVSHMCKKCLM